MDGKPSLEDMWETIEKFGISRKMTDPRKNAPYESVEEMYLVIIERMKQSEEFEKNGHKI